MNGGRLSFLNRFGRDENGATIVEFAVVLCIFFLMFFGLIDFARLGFSNVMAEKATETAVRMAVVRPAACPDVPQVTQRSLLIGTVAMTYPNGSRCAALPGLCADPGTVSCKGSLDNPTVADIWRQVQPLLPVNARPENLEISYRFDAGLNRVGAPYVPIVTVELASLQFDFITPLGALAAAAGSDAHGDLGNSFVFPSMSASLPAEDLR